MLGSIETLVIGGRASGTSPASGAAPGQAMSPARPGHPHAFSSGADKGIAAWEVRAAFREVPGHGLGYLSRPWHPAEDPSHIAFQGQRSCYSCLYQASLYLFRADKVCWARSLDIDLLAGANGFVSAHLLPALPAQKVVVVASDRRPALLESRRTQPGPSSRLSALHGYRELVGHCPQHLLSCQGAWLSQGVPRGPGFWHPCGRELLLCLPMTLLGGGRPEHGLGMESTRLLFLPSTSANKRQYPCVTVRSLWKPALVHRRAPCRAPGLPAQHPARPVQRIPGSPDQHRVSGAWQCHSANTGHEQDPPGMGTGVVQCRAPGTAA